MPPTLTSILAAQLPIDCPPEVLLAPQRDYVRRMLEIAYNQAHDEVERRMELALPCGPETAHRFDIQLALNEVSRCGFSSLTNYLARHVPPGFDASKGLFSITRDTRKAWAKEQAKALLQDREEWSHIAPDIQDEIAQDVAEAWHAGLKQRLCEMLCIADYDLMVSRMTQGQLYKWLLDDKPYWVINRYHLELTPPYLKRLLAQFNESQWALITSHVAHLKDVTTPADATYYAKFQRSAAALVE